MPTIAKTHKYQELNLRHRKLLQLYSVLSEYRLHLNLGLSEETTKYYHGMLFSGGDFSPFLTASYDSMMQSFYIELHGFIGAYIDPVSSDVKVRPNDKGSLSNYLYEKTRTSRKKAAVREFEKLLKEKSDELKMINDLRHKVAHFDKLKSRSVALVPGDVATREILNRLAEILYLLGFLRWNKPHYVENDNNASESTRAVIDVLVSQNRDSKKMRKKYMEARAKWFKSQQ